MDLIFTDNLNKIELGYGFSIQEVLKSDLNIKYLLILNDIVSIKGFEIEDEGIISLEWNRNREFKHYKFKDDINKFIKNNIKFKKTLDVVSIFIKISDNISIYYSVKETDYNKFESVDGLLKEIDY